MQPSDEIKSKIDIVDIIREYIPLKPAGINFRAPCPFHQEKTPSFTVSPEKQIWHCFGCGRGGDIFSFIMEIEGVNFVEALKILAKKAGVVLKRQDPKLQSERNRVLDILDLARRYYYLNLCESKEAASARKYLADRKLTQDTIEEWQIGYSPDNWETIIIFLKKKGYSDKEIFQAGLSVKRQNKPGYYDRFRDRIMFPINDFNGNTVAFSARVKPNKEKEEKMGKYINSPQTIIYDKSKIIFGLDKAKQEIKKNNLAIIVEGQMDVITAHQHGYKNVIASSGTALTSEQIKILKRYTLNLGLAFDMDEAGSLASDRGIQEAMVAEMNVKVIILPFGKDPDECIKKDSKLWEEAIVSARSMMDYYFEKTLSKLDLEQLEDKQRAVKVLLPIIIKLGNKIEQDFWLNRLSENINVDENILRETMTNIKIPVSRASIKEKKSTENSVTPRISLEENLSELFLSLLLKFPYLLEKAIKHIEVEHIIGQDNQKLYKNLLFYYNNINESFFSEENNLREIFSYSNFRNWLLKNGKNLNFNQKIQLDKLDKLALLGDKEFYDIDSSQANKEVARLIIFLKKHHLNKNMKEIEKLIRQAEKENNKNALKELIEEFKSLTEKLNNLE